jgi:hypothetical protein
MSNIFKSNSRFAGLSDDISVNKDKKNDKREKKNDKKNNDKIKNEIKNEIKEEKSIDKFNSFKDEKPDDRFNSFKNNSNNGFRDRRHQMGDREYNRYREEREAEEIKRIELEKKEKERLQQEALKIENFPDLIIKNKKETKQQHEQTMSFIEKIKKESESNKIDIYKDPDLENLKEGWVLFKRDYITNKTIIKKHPRDEKREYEENINSKKYEQEIIKEVCRQLASLHERRTNEYIELYGYDTWEKMFKFPGWREWEEEFDDNSDEDEDDNNEDNYEDDYDYDNEY